MLRGNLIKRDRICEDAGRDRNIVPGEKIVGVLVAADPPFDVREAREHAKSLAVVRKGKMRRREVVAKSRIAGKPIVVVDRAGNVEAGQSSWIRRPMARGPSLAIHDLKTRKRDGRSQPA